MSTAFKDIFLWNYLSLICILLLFPYFLYFLCNIPGVSLLTYQKRFETSLWLCAIYINSLLLICFIIEENEAEQGVPSQDAIPDTPTETPVDPPMDTSQTSSRGSVSKPPAPDEPRLMISKIVTDNFKSYAGKISLGPFHKVIINSLSILFSDLTSGVYVLAICGNKEQSNSPLFKGRVIDCFVFLSV